MPSPRFLAGALLLLAACTLTASQPLKSATFIGPSTQIESYLVPAHSNGISIWSILTVNDSVPLTSDPSKQYVFVGIPDGMGAYLEEDTPDMEYTPSCTPKVNKDYAYPASPTFTLLLNHELKKAAGVARRHGAKGAFVSEYIIDRDTLRVVSGQDLIDQVVTWNTETSSYNPPGKGPSYALDQFCSADLPAVSAFFDAKSGAGTKSRIFMNGEETTNGRAFAHVATGAEKGLTYELPRMGKGGWENQVACPHSGEQTVVMGLDDSTDGQVYVYIGTKQTTGSDIDKAGLTNGKLYGIRVPAFPITAADGKSREPSAAQAMSSTVGSYGPFAFELKLLNGDGDVRNLPEIETASDAAGVTRWFRPEDGSWHPIASKDGSATFYFATTASFTGRSRVWKVVFSDIKNPLAGGIVTAAVEGTELAQAGTPKMVDNLVATCDNVYLQEDPGRQDYLGRIWYYNPKDGLVFIAQHNPKFFAPNAPGLLTRDEESSGIISADGLVTGANRRGQCLIVNTQAHYPIAGELVEGAQLMLMCMDKTVPRFARKQTPYAA